MENEIWVWIKENGEQEYKAHCTKKEEYDIIMGWSKTRTGGTYLIPGKRTEYDVIFPEMHLRRAKKLLGVKRLSD